MASSNNSDCTELTDEELEYVIGGASPEVFEKWKINIINKAFGNKDDDDNKPNSGGLELESKSIF